MKNTLLLCFGLLCQHFVLCQEAYWQQETNYIIDVRLNDVDHSLDGFLKLEYINNSPDTLSFIWFHLWPNAFKNDRTAFSEQLLQNGRTDFYFSGKEERGYINRLDFRTSDNTLDTEDHPLYIDVVKVFLSRPLPPSSSVEITTPFNVKLPKNFSRGGHTGRSYQVTQWYPKPAVYDRKGWHPMPYFDQGEFYSELGSFDVRITLPKEYVVAATGELQSGQEPGVASQESGVGGQESGEGKKRVENTTPKNTGKKAATVKSRAKSKSLKTSKKKSATKLKTPLPAAVSKLPTEFRTLQYKQENVHDFAWFADKNFIVKKDTIKLQSGRIIKVYSYYTSTENKGWNNSIQYIKDAVQFRSQVIGEYPYNVISVVQAKMGFEGGMEYPTITSISPINDEKALEEIIEHEIGHNWFYGIIASNERDHPWMDEGMNSYYDKRYQEWKYGDKRKEIQSNWMTRKLPADIENVLINAYSKQKMDQPVSTSSHQFTELNYSLIAYAKAALWMKQLENYLGRERFDSCMKVYYHQWQFKHPSPDDFQSIIQLNAGKDVSNHFRALHQTGLITDSSRKLKPAFLFSLRDTDKFNYVNVLPAVGYNKYDGFMPGVVVHNFNLPSSALQFIAVPLYATGTKQLKGLGSIGYSFFPDKRFQRIQIAVGGASFSSLKGIDSNSNTIYGGFTKITPSIRFTFKNKFARSTLEKWVEGKTYLIGEKGFDYNMKSMDSMFYPTEGNMKNRYLNQLTFNVTDYRALYPYDVQLQLQQGDGFYRINAIANYFFNYSKGGGMRLRFFAGKFGYIGGKTEAKELATTAYQPKLTAVRGSEDYTYSNYFIGRNEFEHFASQQIMLRDGGLKLRTDAFYELQGRSDNWVSSLNFSTSLPRIDFPVKLPMRIFFDIGTYAEAWEKGAATSRFLYVGGLQLSLFKDLLNVYAPLIYSREFRDELKTLPSEDKFFKRLSFSIDVHRFNLRRIVGHKVPF